MNLGLKLRGFVTYKGVIPGHKAAMLFLLLAGLPLSAEPLRVVAFGDSLTYGYGLPVEDGFVPQLQAWLADHDSDAMLVNAGVSGDTTAGGRARVAWTLSDGYSAMILTLGGNDLLRGIDPASSRANIAAILATAKAENVKVFLVGMRAPSNYGLQYQESFDALYPDLAQEYDAVYFPNFFLGLGPGAPAELLEFMQADGIHPNAKGVTRIVDAMGPQVLAWIKAGAQ